MFPLDEDIIRDIYSKQQKTIERDRWFDEEYSKRYSYLNECIEKLRAELTPKQDILMQRLLGAMQMYNEYNELKRFGKDMKCMYDFGMCLKNKY
ncbi:MAG: hypothetical protein E7396_00380 [Ruminococcaceae bacterium]|nr:hypothetical protein [Oscillospiraceae bacterium]